MARSPLRIVALAVVALAGVALAAGGRDRLAQRWPLATQPSSVTVKLPPPRTPAPGFAFAAAPAPAKSELR